MDKRFDDEREIEELWHSIRSDALRRGADLHTAEDVAQEAWLQAVRRPPEERGRMRGWLHVVAQRVLRDMRSTRGHRARRELEVARPDHAEPAETDESTLLRYVDELPDAYRTVLRLRFVEDREVQEIGELLQLGAETVRSRLKRGIARLRSRIEAPAERRGLLGAALALIRRRTIDLLESVAPTRRRQMAAGVAGLVCVATWLLWNDARRPQELGATAVLAAEPDVERPLLSASAPSAPIRALPESTPPSSPAAPEANGQRFSGFVRTPAGEPMPGALVHAARPGKLEDEVVVQADEHGRYEIVAGRRDLLWASEREWCDSRLCYLLSVLEPERLDLVLSPTRGRASVLVLDESGAPAADAVIELDPLDNSDQTRATRGTIECSGPPISGRTAADGRAELAFPAREWIDLFVRVEGKPALLERRPTPEPGGTLTIRLPAPCTLSGICVDEAGVKSWKARVEVLQLGGLVQREVWTGPDGSFRIDGLSPGEFVLRCGEDPELGHRSARHDGILEPGSSESLRLVVGEAASLHGIVLDQGRPVPDMHVQLWSRGNDTAEGVGMRDTLTDERGRFAFAGCRSDVEVNVRALPGGSRVGPDKAVLPGQGDVFLELVTESSLLAPIELYFRGEAIDLPLLVELRMEPGFSLVLEPSPDDPRRFRSPPLRQGNFIVVAWNATVGAWQVAVVPHEPSSPREHELEVEQPGYLELALALPPGVHREEVEATLLVESFDVFGLGALGRWRAKQGLAWDPDAAVYSGELAPGEYSLVVRAPGMAEIEQTFRVDAGEAMPLELQGLPGCETTIDFRSPRFLYPNESLEIEAQTPFGVRRIPVPWRNQRVIPGGFSLTVSLPASATELEVTTWNPYPVPILIEGHRSIAIGELDTGAPAHLEFELEQAVR